jgi:hypothetical protein
MISKYSGLFFGKMPDTLYCSLILVTGLVIGHWSIVIGKKSLDTGHEVSGVICIRFGYWIFLFLIIGYWIFPILFFNYQCQFSPMTNDFFFP